MGIAYVAQRPERSPQSWREASGTGTRGPRLFDVVQVVFIDLGPGASQGLPRLFGLRQVCTENIDAILQERRTLRRKADATPEIEHLDELARAELERGRG